MVSIILTLALSTPCFGPPVHKHKLVMAAPQSCTAVMCYQPTAVLPEPESIFIPQYYPLVEIPDDSVVYSTENRFYPPIYIPMDDGYLPPYYQYGGTGSSGTVGYVTPPIDPSIPSQPIISKAPELDSASQFTALTVLCFGLAVIRGKRS